MFKYEKLNLCKQDTSAAIERVVEFSPPGVEIENIAKVLTLAVEGKIISVTAHDGYVDAEGRVNFKLMYVDRDGAPKGVDYNADFSVKIECDCSEGDSVSAYVDVAEADVSANGELLLSAVIEVTAKITSSSEIEALVDAERCFKTMKKVCGTTFKTAKSAIVPVYDEIMAAGDVENVLLLDSRVTIKKASAEENMIRVEGLVFAAITYSDGAQIITKQLDIPVVEEIAAEGVGVADKISAEATVKNAHIVLQGVTGDNVIRFEGELALKLQVFSDFEIEAVEDMFMLTNETTLNKSDAENNCYRSSKCFTERVSGTAVLNENRPAARDVCALPYARCFVSKSEVTEDGLTVEGIVNTDIIYLDENGFNSVRTEIPFSVMIAGEFSPNTVCRCVVEEISARIKRDRELEVNLSLCICANEYEVCGFEYVSGVEVGDAKEQNTSGLSLYLASSGDEMWDVCKALTATPDEILAQNPTLEMPLGEGEKVIFFRKLA